MFGAHKLLLRPRESRSLRLIAHELELTPAAAVTWAQDVFGNAVATVTFQKPADRLVIWHKNKRQTEMQVKLSRDTNGNYWLGVLANPTSRLNGYNAFAVALADTKWHAERRRFVRVPFIVLRRIVQSVDPRFKWHPDTARRIKDLGFRNCPAQVFTYLLTSPFTPQQIMGYMRCVYSTPYKVDGDNSILLCDDLDIEMHCKRGKDGVQTLLFIFRKSGRIVFSVNFYDKFAKARRSPSCSRSAGCPTKSRRSTSSRARSSRLSS